LNRTAFLRAAAAAAGVAMFVQSLRVLGTDRILDGVARMGWAFAVIVLLSGARELVRTLAWMRTVERPARLRFGPAFRARLVGEALNALLPIGMVVGEPTKASHVGSDISFPTALKALVVEFAFYGVSLAVLLAAGSAAFVLAADAQNGVRMLTYAATACAAIGFASLGWLARVRARPRRFADRGGRAADIASWAAGRLRGMRDVVFGFSSRHPDRVRTIVALEITYQLLAVAEVYVTLLFVGALRPTIAAAIALETVSRVVTMAFKMVPLRAGVDEVGSAFVASQLHLGAATGLTLALVRKIRLLFWSAAGLALLFGWRRRAESADGRLLVSSLRVPAQSLAVQPADASGAPIR